MLPALAGYRGVRISTRSLTEAAWMSIITCDGSTPATVAGVAVSPATVAVVASALVRLVLAEVVGGVPGQSVMFTASSLLVHTPCASTL